MQSTTLAETVLEVDTLTETQFVASDHGVSGSWGGMSDCNFKTSGNWPFPQRRY